MVAAPPELARDGAEASWDTGGLAATHRPQHCSDRMRHRHLFQTKHLIRLRFILSHLAEKRLYFQPNLNYKFKI